jgi:hypothetical protein
MRTQGRIISEDASTIARKRIAASAISMTIAAVLIILGILQEEMGEVMFNACMLCLSCIGIG